MYGVDLWGIVTKRGKLCTLLFETRHEAVSTRRRWNKAESYGPVVRVTCTYEVSDGD
jgi:hypothetical protein